MDERVELKVVQPATVKAEELEHGDTFYIPSDKPQYICACVGNKENGDVLYQHVGNHLEKPRSLAKNTEVSITWKRSELRKELKNEPMVAGAN